MRALAPVAALAGLLALTPLAVIAQEQPNLMIVFDASGSMWGQIRGRTKIELAREALSSVLSEADGSMQIGMITYGHRVRGQCSDIELAVPAGPAAVTVPQMLSFANRVNPRGMTPLTDSVLMAAQTLGFTEQTATVVLLTDGIETCAGDPCALGRLLAREGIDFRAHVVGFDLSDAEQRQVSCLAEETGGLFLAANDAGTLRDALSRTLSLAPLPTPEPEPQPDPATLPRAVELILRDVAGGPVLTGRPFRVMEFLPLDEGAEVTGRLDLSANPGPLTGRVELRPGRYTLMALRQTDGREPIRIALPVEIPEGTGTHTLDLVIAARLQLNVLLNGGQRLGDAGADRDLPRVAGYGRAHVEIMPVVDGAIDASVNYGGINSRDVALPPGDYFVRVSLHQYFGRERLISVPPGVTTVVDVDLGAAVVAVDLRDPQGVPVERYQLRAFDLDAAEAFVGGNGRGRADVNPLYLPQGTWRVEAVAERGDRRPAIAWITVAPGQPQTLHLTPGQTLGSPGDVPEDAAAQCLDTHREHGCMVDIVTPVDMVRHLGLNGHAVLPQIAPRYTGTWQTQGGMMALMQDGRRVWGEVHVNGGIGLVWGYVSPDGLTLRGAMDRSSNPRGAVELRIDPLGERMTGVWDHSIGRARNTVLARRLSGGLPPLTRASGTEDDLRVTMSGGAWDPAGSAEFAAFMALATGPASPDTGDDIDAMQAAAAPVSFTGSWNTNHDVVTLWQEGRSVEGHYRGRSLWGQASADGQLLRGVWDDGANRWGLFEFRLNAGRDAFAGAWGTGADSALGGGAWTGTRRSWLVERPAPVTPRAQAMETGLAPFFAPVRDAETPASSDAGGNSGGPVQPAPVDAQKPGLDRASDQGAGGGATGTVEVGTLPPLPPGIYGMGRARSASELAQVLADGGRSGEWQGEFANSCGLAPYVIHPDGLIAIRVHDSLRAAGGLASWVTNAFLRCTQSGPLFACDGFNLPLASNPDAGMRDYTLSATLVSGTGGVFALDEGGGNAMVFQSCMGAGNFLSANEVAPSGRRIIDHIADREDGVPSVAFDAAGQVIGQHGPVATAPAPAPVASSGPLDFAALAGVWHDPARGGCSTHPVVLHADGAIAAWSVYEGGTMSELSSRMACDAAGECRVLADPPPPPGRDRVRLQRGGPGLEMCLDGPGCVVGLARCDMTGAPPHLIDALMARPWEAGAATTKRAPLPRPF